MDDVVGEIVLAGRDEDLRAGDEVGAVAGGHGSRTDHTEVRAGVCLGEAHRTGPRAVDEPRQEALLELVVAPPLECVHGAVREQRVHAEREVRGAQHLVEDDAGDVGQPLPAERGRRNHRRPSALAVGGVAFAEPARRADGAVLVVTPFGVTGLVQWLEYVLAEPRGLLEGSEEQIRRGVGVARQGGNLPDVEDVLEHESNVGERGFVCRHLGFGGYRER